ncbi:hypothetical protein [Streptomyces harbinensis]|uniref:Uncharacterized protein n=1 Tax=Streptomyces harbinensis TaxID=1176198 RepID=A0A1I6WCC8_9ACTN|nr:hypothetical protein [Streptomyces harbinensis]SFT23638.1 hypothetical protein SAMN05444716_11917 [Streptomyces harbinensis]
MSKRTKTTAEAKRLLEEAAEDYRQGERWRRQCQGTADADAISTGNIHAASRVAR